jgi:hypothetical protein
MTANKSSKKKMAEFKYLETIAINRDSRNVCYPPVLKLLQSPFVSKILNIKIYKKNYEYNFIVVFYGYETWSLILREENRLKGFENRVLRGIFRPNLEEVTGGWRRLHNEEV